MTSLVGQYEVINNSVIRRMTIFEPPPQRNDSLRCGGYVEGKGWKGERVSVADLRNRQWPRLLRLRRKARRTAPVAKQGQRCDYAATRGRHDLTRRTVDELSVGCAYLWAQYLSVSSKAGIIIQFNGFEPGVDVFAGFGKLAEVSGKERKCFRVAGPIRVFP